MPIHSPGTFLLSLRYDTEVLHKSHSHVTETLYACTGDGGDAFAHRAEIRTARETVRKFKGLPANRHLSLERCCVKTLKDLELPPQRDHGTCMDRPVVTPPS
jgi:hypothetical protein